MTRRKKTKTKRREVKTNNSLWQCILKAVLISSGVSLVLILILAMIMYMGWLGTSAIAVANMIIKILGAMLCAAIATRSICKKNIVIGMLCGALYIVVAFIVFALLSGNFGLSTNLLCDIAMGAAAGAVIGVIPRKCIAKNA